MRLMDKCPFCGGEVRVSAVRCQDCGTEVSGLFSLSALSRLPYEDQRLIEEFLLCDGKLKDLARKLGVSYPTVRLRLDKVIARLKALMEEHRAGEIRCILNQVDKGNVSADVASKLIKEL